jgi:hypothetical protein
MSYRDECEKLYIENIELKKQLEEANKLIDELLKKEQEDNLEYKNENKSN